MTPDERAEAGIAQPKVRRVQYGRNHSYQIDGHKVPGVTTILSKGWPKPALVGWAAREAAEYVAGRREILTQLSDSELVELVKGAPNRKRDEAAVRGTDLHHIATRLAHGEEVEVPDPIRGRVDSYLAFLGDFNPTEALIEVPVFSRRFMYAGTADMLARTRHLGLATSGYVLFDIKTSGSGIYADVALQLAGYGRADFYARSPEWAERPMPPIDHYVAVWVRDDGYDAYEIEVTDREWQAFRCAAYTTWWTENRQSLIRGESLWTPPERGA
jgi:hypothetical protein